MKNKIIEVQDIKINTININEKDYICISDIAKAKSDKSRALDILNNAEKIKLLGDKESNE